MNKCEAGHKQHKTTWTPTQFGTMLVYDTDKYPKDITGYCNGKDDISRTILRTGGWETQETMEIWQILFKNRRHGEVQHFFDIGSHIGWYSLIAANLGYSVTAYDGDAENLELLMSTAEIQNIADRITPWHKWFGPDTTPIEVGYPEIELVKMDIEGSEQHAVRFLGELIKLGKVKHIYAEISPVFNSSYPELVDFIEGCGYRAFDQGQTFDHKYDFTQKNLLFKRSDL